MSVSTVAGDRARVSPRAGHRWKKLRDNARGYLMILPWLVGFICFTAGPMLASAWLSLTSYDIFNPPRWIGLASYARMLNDRLFYTALRNTAEYALMAVPLQIVSALFFAILLNQKVKGVGIFRTLFYLPSVMPDVANAALWMFLLNPQFGIVNMILTAVGLPPSKFLTSMQTVRPTMAMLNLWYIGTMMVVFLAALQGVPEELYEAADIDGATRTAKFVHVTVPMISPSIFFNSIIGLIGAFQIFSFVYVATYGGPANASLMYMLHIYRHAFENLRMGYAAALAWVLFVIVLILTLIQFRLAKRWVYYEGEGEANS
jgi:multiple sugar transport system permease protein